MKVENLWEMQDDDDELKSVDELANRPWGVVVNEKTAFGEHHLYPKHDTPEHVVAPTCWCRPFLDPTSENIWIHRRKRA